MHSESPRRTTKALLRILLIVCLGAPALSIRAAAQEIEWLRQFGAIGVDEAIGMAKDSTGIYVAGYTDTSLPGQTAVRLNDAFIRKYDLNGTELWTRQFGTLFHDQAAAVAVDATGVYVAGAAGPTLPGETAIGGGDAFIRKYDLNGTELWTHQFGTRGNDFVLGLAANSTGVYLAGYLEGTLAEQQVGLRDAFVRKYNANGTEQWTHQFGTTANDEAWAIALDATGFYITGYTRGDLVGQNAGGNDIFVRRYDLNGSAQWTRQFGGVGDDGGQGIAVNASGVYAGGIAGLGTALPGQTNAGARDAFLRKYDANGTEQWTRQFGTIGNDQVLGAYADSDSVYVTGTVNFAFPDVPSDTRGHIFVRTYDLSGTVQETAQFGAGGAEFGTSVIADGTDVYLAGYTNGPIPGQTFLGGYDAFVAKLVSSPAPAEISLGTRSLRFSGFVGGGTERQALQIGTSGGTLSWQAAARTLNGTGWLVASPPSGTATANLTSRLIVEVDFGAFSTPGIYQAVIVIEDAGGGVLARVPITVAANAAGSRLRLSQSAFVFRTIEGGAVRPQELRVGNAGQGSMSWTIFEPQNWLSISNLSGTASAGDRGSSTTLSGNTAGLSAGVYQELVRVSAPGAGNNPQLVTVTLHVAPASTPALPELSSNGILFAIGEGILQLPVFDLQLGNAGGGSATFQLDVETESGGNWLAVSTVSGSVGSQGTAVSVRLNLTSLAFGTYRARVRANFTPGGTREVEVVLIFSGFPFTLAREGPTAAQCSPSSMEMVVNSIGTGSVLPVSFPRPLRATVADSCGNPVDDATVGANADGRPIALLPLGDGEYIGTWTPERQSSSSVVSFLAAHPTYPTVERTVTVSTEPAAGDASLPVLFPDGVVEGAAFTSQRPLAPGGIVSLFGSQFAAADAVSLSLPLRRDLGGVKVQIGEEDAPLYYAGPGQINAQVPYSVQPGNDVPVVTSVNGQYAAPQTYQIAPVQPGIFLAGDGGAILDGNSDPVNAANPAQRGDVLQIFATGLGETDPPGQTGEGAPASSRVLLPVTVTVGGVNAPVEYAGLAPGFVGLYQVNARVPTTVTPGDSVEVVIEQNGISSNPDRPATIPVE